MKLAKVTKLWIQVDDYLADVSLFENGQFELPRGPGPREAVVFPSSIVRIKNSTIFRDRAEQGQQKWSHFHPDYTT